MTKQNDPRVGDAVWHRPRKARGQQCNGKIVNVLYGEDEIIVRFHDGDVVSFHQGEFEGLWDERFGGVWMLDN